VACEWQVREKNKTSSGSAISAEAAPGDRRQAMSTASHDRRTHYLNHCPVGHLVGIVSDAQAAEEAVKSLYAAGYTDVEVLDGQPALEAIGAMERTANPLVRAWERLSAYFSDDSDARRDVLVALRRGHAVVMVGASGAAQERQAEGILRAHGARALRYCGRWAITDIRQ
jgi:hypothetical protein